MSDLHQKIEKLYNEFLPQWQNADGGDANLGYLTGVIDILEHLRADPDQPFDEENRDPDAVYIVWHYDDVQSLCPQLSDEEAIEALQEVAENLKDRSTEEGWEILETLLEMHNYPTRSIDE
jgi:hypothetical protein